MIISHYEGIKKYLQVQLKTQDMLQNKLTRESKNPEQMEAQVD